MKKYTECLWGASDNWYTKGMVRGSCEHFTDRNGRRCHFGRYECGRSGGVMASSFVLGVLLFLAILCSSS